MKLAWVTPFSAKSAIAQCSSSIVRALPSALDVTIFASDIENTNQALRADVPIRILKGANNDDLARDLAATDVLIYNLGDHYEFHRRTFELSKRVPGIIILHDLVMHHFFSGYYLADRRDEAGYLAELQYAHGAAGKRVGEEILKGTYGPNVWDTPLMLEYHMARSAARNAYGVVVHSRFALAQLQGLVDAPVRQIDFPAPLEPSGVESLSGVRPSGSSESMHMLTFGVVNRNKFIEEIIRTIGTSPILRERVTYNVLGEYRYNELYYGHLRRTIEEWGLEGQVQLLGYQAQQVLRTYLRDADVVVNVRNPHFGEGSWSLLESMTAGKATVVWRHGYYDEMPDDTVVKVGSLEELRTALESLCADPDRRRAIGRRAAEHARERFVAERYARQLLEFHETVRYHAPVLRLTDFVGTTLDEVGETQARVVDEIAAEISAVVGLPAAAKPVAHGSVNPGSAG